MRYSPVRCSGKVFVNEGSQFYLPPNV